MAGLPGAVAWGGVRAIRAVGTDHLPRLDTLAVDGAVLVFAVTAAALSALLGGLSPPCGSPAPTWVA